MGIGDWGLGIGDWAQSPIPNPQSPIPNPHLTLLPFILYNLNLTFNLNNFHFFDKINKYYNKYGLCI